MRVISHPAPLLTTWPELRQDAWNPALDGALVNAPGTEATMERLHAPNALVVTTGQQPGLFTGPIYTIHKALAAAALAKRLSRDWNRPVVPMFWIAGDDHDFAEASNAAWLGPKDELVKWNLPPRAADAPQHSMAVERLPKEVNEGLIALEASLTPGNDRENTLNWLREYYRPGATLHAAFRDALANLLASYGVLCIDPTTPMFKRAQAPLLAEALRQATALDTTLAALPDPETGIVTGQGATLVSIETVAGRDRLLIDGSGFIARRSREKFTLDALLNTLELNPERFSANVLLRPVVESALLPTVAYVAGPAEQRYLTRQAIALYGPLGVRVQTPVPRWGGTTVDERTDRLLRRLQVTAEAALYDDGSLGREILQRDVPEVVEAALTSLREEVDNAVKVLEESAGEIDQGLVRSITGRGTHLSKLVDDLDKRFQSHLRRRSDIAYHQYERVQAVLHPEGALQERVLTAATFLGRHGDSWLQAIVAATTEWADELSVTAP